MKRRIVVIGTFASFAWAALHVGVGCDDDSATGAGGGGDPTADVIYEAGATDEALEALLAAAVVSDDAQAAYLLSPADGAAVSTSTPATFSWQVGPPTQGAASRRPGQRLAAAQHEPLGLGLSGGVLRVDPPRASDDLLALFGPCRSAFAHGAPVNGRGYLLVIEDAQGKVLRRVFTLDLTHTPDPDGWAALAGTSGALRASVLNAIFEDNRVASDGGPWQGPAVTFSFAP